MPERNNDTVYSHYVSFQRGEEKGFAYFFRLHYKALRYFATRLVDDSVIAEDLVEDCFVRFFERRKTIESPDTIKAYLYTAVRNACLNHLNREKTKRNAEEEIEYQASLERLSFNDMVRADLLDRVSKAVEQLPRGSRKVFQMFYFERKSYKEIAEELGISENTVRNQKVRGLFLLKKKFLPVILLLSLISNS